MPSTTSAPVSTESERAELETVLQSPLFARSPTLAHLLSYLCEKVFAGESGQIKEYSIALDVFSRKESFDQDTDSIVRVQANRLRKRLAEYYVEEGAGHRIHITIPVGQYIPIFEERVPAPDSAEAGPPEPISSTDLHAEGHLPRLQPRTTGLLLFAIVAAVIVGVFLLKHRQTSLPVAPSAPSSPQAMLAPSVGLPVGDEIRILTGASRNYVDRSGKPWGPDAYFTGGSAVRSSIQHIWRTQDPTIYRTSRQGDFTYDIPLKTGTYELHLHFAETFYGPDAVGGGGEGSRVMTITANGKPLLTDFDVLADSGGGRTADVKVFTEIAPASDGKLHLGFSSVKGGRAIVSAIEILPGLRGRMRPVRIVARDVPYYSNDSHWWSSDIYFKGGQLIGSEEPAAETDDPELYETTRWGHFSYAIPVTPGRYTVILHFIERRFGLPDQGAGELAPDSSTASESRVFDVYCNGEAIVRNLNALDQAGDNHPLVRKISGLEPNAQGKLVLEFVPVSHYAMVTAIEVIPQ
jgi:hypothetical protein